MKQKILHFLLAVLIAFGVWTYVVTVVSPESENTYYNIPVVLNNEDILLDKGLMVVSNTQPTVTLQLRGNRSDLNNLKNSDITIIADLSKINAAGEQSLSCNVFFTGNGENNAFEILNQNPQYITLEVAQWATKEVSVVVNYTGTPGLEYIDYRDEAVLDHEVITITGPKSVVDQITQARVDVDLDGRVESFSESYRYTLCNEKGEPVDAASIKTNAAEVGLTLKIQRVKEIQLLLNVTYGGGATQETTSIVLDHQVIKISGSEKMLEGFDSLVLGSVNLAEVLEDTAMTFPVNLPDGIENLSGITEVNAEISFPELATKTLNVSKILVTGTPEGMNVDIATKMVTVTVRGPKELVESIEANNVTVLVDLSQAQPGENLYRARIMVDTAFEEVGAIGTYNVLVSLTELAGGTE